MMMGGGEVSLPNYLCFTALEDNSTITRSGTYTASLEYSLDGSMWNVFDANTIIALNTGDIVYFRGENVTLGSSTSNYTRFVMTGSIKASGNIMSLLSKTNFSNMLAIPSAFCFEQLFCNCASLTTSPELPATSLKSNCYQAMFSGCTNLNTAPELPALTLSTSCYFDMFKDCKALTTAPILPAPTGDQQAYSRMFNGCDTLNYVKMLIISNVGYNGLSSWMRNTPNTSSCIFVKHINATWTTTGVSGVPTNWTVIYYDPSEDKYYTSQDKSQECDDHGNPL